MRTTNQPLTKAQKKELAGFVALDIRLIGIFGFLVIGLLVGAFFRKAKHSLNTTALDLWWMLPTVLLMAWFYRISGRWTGGSKFREQVKADLAQGVAAYHEVHVVEVIEVEEQEDEGPSYIIKTLEGEVLLLTGQYLDRYKAKKFPWSSFAIMESPASKVFFGLKKLGDPVKASYKRPPFTMKEHKQFNCRNFCVVSLDFEALKQTAFPTEVKVSG